MCFNLGLMTGSGGGENGPSDFVKRREVYATQENLAPCN